MIKFSRSVFVPAPVADVFNFCASREGFRQQFPFNTKWLSGPSHWSKDDMLEFKYRVAGLWMSHRAQIVDFKVNEYFVDTMTHGIYKHFRHKHQFTTDAKGTLVRDEVEFTFGFGLLIDKLIGLPTLKSAFEKRHSALLKYFDKEAGYAK